MPVRRALRRLLSTNDADVIVECRHCGTSVTPDTEECPTCGTTEFSRYEIPA